MAGFPRDPEIAAYWDKRLCGSMDGEGEVGTRGWFDGVARERYRKEPFILKTMGKTDSGGTFEWFGKRVLEVGCGLGTDAVYMVNRGVSYSGIDLSGGSVDLARKNLAEHYLPSSVVWRQSITDPRLRALTPFDMIYSWGVLHHTPDIKASIHAIHCLLKPGGTFIGMLYRSNALITKLWGILKYQTPKEFIATHYDGKDCPIVNSYTVDEVRRLFKAWKIERLWLVNKRRWVTIRARK